MQQNPHNFDWCSLSEKSRKELVALMRNNREKSYNLKNELKEYISFLPSNKKKFKIEDLYTKENACKVKLNQTKKKNYRELLEKTPKFDGISRDFYYKESNEMLSVTQFMSKYMDHLNMK